MATAIAYLFATYRTLYDYVTLCGLAATEPLNRMVKSKW